MAESGQSSTPNGPTATGRKLAVIMFTDIAGYTDLMGRDRDAALDLLLKNKELHKALVREHNGNLLKEIGDGNMCAFDTASEAVDFAISIQSQSANTPQLKLRIGIHLGEIVMEDGDAFGDGVNIASRLQSIANPGDIYVSDAIQKAIRGRTDIQSEDLGEQELKNVDYPVKVHSIRSVAPTTTEEDAPIAAELGRRQIWRAAAMYTIVGALIWKVSEIGVEMLGLSVGIVKVVQLILILGFPVAMALAWFYEWSPKGFVRIGSQAAKDNPLSGSQKKPLTSNTYMVVLITTFLALFLIFPSGQSGPAAGMEASEASVAVIPFQNVTGNAELDYYGVGLASEIRTQLALSKQFDFVSSMMATTGYKNTSEPPQTVGAQLGVTHILSGMYQGPHDGLQVVVELVEASTGKIVWSFPYQSTYEDLFVLQASIADRVMEKFDGEEVEHTVSTFNIEAFAELARGIEVSSLSNDPNFQFQTKSYFERAIQLDSTLLPAWVELIGIYAYHYFTRPHDSTVTAEMVNNLVGYVDQNFEESWETNVVKGINAYWVEKDYEKGRAFFHKALEENPDSQWANSLLQPINRRTMRYSEAIKYGSKSARLYPSPIAWRELGLTFWNNGDFENAELAFKTAYSLNPNSLSVNGTYFALMRQQNAVEDLPQELQRKFGARYDLQLLSQDRKHSEALRYLDSVVPDTTFTELEWLESKALAHFALNEVDSARFHASAFLKLLDDPSGPAFGAGRGGLASLPFATIRMHGIMGNEVDFLALFPWPKNQLEQDLTYQWAMMTWELNHFVFSKRYDDATSKLKEMNSRFPDWGNYAWLNLPEFDRIKEEHPPFQDAINSLRLPPLVSETNPMKM